MANEQIIIPKGWTYFAHRTNTERWQNNPFDQMYIKVKNNQVMSVITENDIYQEISHYGPEYLQTYSNGKGEPFEIRCIIAELSYLYPLKDNDEIMNIMFKEFYYDRNNFGGCYGNRHHSIPRGDELIVIGIGEYDETYNNAKKIIWTIPRRFLEVYVKAIQKGENRTINLKFLDKNEKKR